MSTRKRSVHLLLRILVCYIRRQVIRHIRFTCQQFGWRKKEICTVCKAIIILVDTLFRVFMEGIMSRDGADSPHPSNISRAHTQ